MRETADLLRGAQEESGGNAILASYGLGSNLLQSYLPEIIDIRDRSGSTLPQLMADAHAGRKSLYVAWAYDDFHANHYNAGLVLLKNPALFEPVAAFPGIEPDFYHRIVRLR